MLYVISISVAGCYEPSPLPSSEHLARRALVSVWLDGEAHCLGVAIDAETVITAKHCVQRVNDMAPLHPGRFIVVGSGSGRQVVAVEPIPGGYQQLGELVGRDLAILEVRGEPLEGAKMTNTPLGSGDEVFFLPRDGGDARSGAVRASTSRELMTDPLTCEGDSGGPLFDSRGSVVGIASWRSGSQCGDGLSAFVQLGPNSEWLEEARSRRSSKQRPMVRTQPSTSTAGPATR